MMTPSPWIVALTLLGLSSGGAPAWANPSLAPEALSITDALYVAPHSAEHLSQVANRIQRLPSEADQSPPKETSTPRPLPFIPDLWDKEGNLNLPLDLIVYDTMGDASIGFGSEF